MHVHGISAGGWYLKMYGVLTKAEAWNENKNEFKCYSTIWYQQYLIVDLCLREKNRYSLFYDCEYLLRWVRMITNYYKDAILVVWALYFHYSRTSSSPSDALQRFFNYILKKLMRKRLRLVNSEICYMCNHYVRIII